MTKILNKKDSELDEELEDIALDDDDELSKETQIIENRSKDKDTVEDRSETIYLGEQITSENDSVLDDLTEKPDNKYVFQRSIGHGGMKTILQVKDKDTARDVAMAVVLPSESEEKKQEKINQFIKEARITANLEHPNIVPVHEIGVDNSGSPYFTMKLVKGETLSSILAKLAEGDEKYVKRYKLTNLLFIFRKVCNAIAFAHSKGVVHLDLTPENIQIGRFGEVQLLDWGLAKAVGKMEIEKKPKEPKPASPGKINVTMDGVVKGTPGYMAPEQAAGKNSQKNFQTDIYALEAILYSILTYKSPIDGKEISEMLNDTIYGNIIPPKKRVPEKFIPSALEAVAMKAMHVNQEERYQKVLELREDIDNFISGFATSAERAGVVKKNVLLIKRHKLASTFACLAIIIMFAFGYFALKEYSKQVAGWIPVYQEDFTSGMPDLGELRFMNRFMSRATMPWRLTKNGLKVEKMNWLWLKNLKLKGNAKVDLTVLFASEPKAFEVCINSNIAPLKKWWFIPPGCAFQIGRYGGAKNVICKKYQNRKTEVITSMPAKLEVGKVHNLTFKRENEVLSISINGIEAGRVVDLFLPFEDTMNKIGLRSFGEDMYIQSINVSRLALPEKASPLIAGDALAEAQYYEDAISKYLTIAENYNGSPVAEKALIKAYVTAATKLDGREQQLAIQRIKTKIAFEFSGFAYQDKLLEIDALTLWRNKKYSEALKLLPQIFDLNPGTRILINFLQEEHEPLNDKITYLLLEWLAKTQNLSELNLSDMGLISIKPLAKLPLVFLDCSNNQLESIAPLALMPLEELNISRNNIDSLVPLSNTPIVNLNCSYNPIHFLGPITKLPLKSLNLSGCNNIKDFSPLLEIKTLEELRLPEDAEAIEILKQHPQLQKIAIGTGELQSTDYFWTSWRNSPDFF